MTNELLAVMAFYKIQNADEWEQILKTTELIYIQNKISGKIISLRY